MITEQYPNSKKIWEESEENRLACLAKADTDLYQICKELGRSPLAVILRLRQLSGLERPYPRDMIPPELLDDTLSNQERYRDYRMRWAQMDDDRLMKEFHDGKTVLELSKELGRSTSSIITRIYKLNPKPLQMKTLYGRAKEFLGKKRIVKVEPSYPRYFRHFKGGLYKALMEGKDSETQEAVVIYQALYGERGIWVRPKSMFYEHVERPDYSGPRFTEISEEEAIRGIN